MTRGRVYLWTPDPATSLGGRVRAELVELPRLAPGRHLQGQHVAVRDAGVIIADEPGAAPVPLGDATADAAGDFVFDPSGGGPRVDRGPIDPAIVEQARQAAAFGQVNTYFHLDRGAAHLNRLLNALGEPALPRLVAVVNAHPAVTGGPGPIDGARRRGRWVPFQGGHYRLPGPRAKLIEREPVSALGEIHLGPGHQRLDTGALAAAAGGPYRHNASHNAGILYHELGHHLTRHTADLLRNRLRPVEMQDNRKTSFEEGVCDYLAGALLETPHIWAWHRRHDDEVTHRRTLSSAKTLADFDAGPDADLHGNGTIWAAALWALRDHLRQPAHTDLLLVRSLVLWGRLPPRLPPAWIDGADSYPVGLALLLRADAELFASTHRDAIVSAFEPRGITAIADAQLDLGEARASRRVGDGR